MPSWMGQSKQGWVGSAPLGWESLTLGAKLPNSLLVCSPCTEPRVWGFPECCKPPFAPCLPSLLLTHQLVLSHLKLLRLQGFNPLEGHSWRNVRKNISGFGVTSVSRRDLWVCFLPTFQELTAGVIFVWQRAPRRPTQHQLAALGNKWTSKNAKVS